MKQFRLFTGNRVEILAELLANVLKTPLKSALDKEVIVVQSKGMARWISMELARYHGVCANISFRFPNDFIYENFQNILSGLPETSPCDPEIMTWKLMKLLMTCTTKPEFEILENYLEGNGESLRRFQLSERIADIYDQYLIFRPDMISKWEQGKENHWQAMLWRELIRGDEGMHRAGLRNAFFEVLENALKFGNHKLKFPERISVFGISGLPRFHIEVLDAISWFTEVNFFLMNPCGYYWGDILSKGQIKRLAAKDSLYDTDSEALHIEQGNSLLASMGTLGRDFFDLMNEFVSEEYPYFEEPGENTLLSCIQSDIVNLRERGSESKIKDNDFENDTSIQIHSCHSPMREIEVLHDRLLQMFESDPTLRPRDILVMTPDIEIYSPYIQAVFDLPADDSKRIPFSIADRSIRTESRIIDTFMTMLDLTNGRFGAAQIFSVLESPAVCRKFSLSDADLDIIRRWVQDTRIRWGIDSENRRKLGLPDMPENTWKTGLDRLVLGYAMPGGEEKMFSDILPYDFIEGNEASLLGKFLEFTKRLFFHVEFLEKRQTLTEWSDTLKKILDAFFEPDENTEDEAQKIRTRLNQLAEAENEADFNEKIDINVIRCYLRNYFKKEPSRFGFIAGGVTFCAMLPMRSIPFRVICLTGMNSDAYPRQSESTGFDLMAKNIRPGDPSRRNDDRYLFLESVLSAREKLYISYVGQNIRDNSVAPPSVLVSELMDYIEKGFEIPDKKILKDHILIIHRLQAFSPEYFRNSELGTRNLKLGRLFSYSEENLEAARCLLKNRKTPAPFISKCLSDPETEWKTINLSALCRFFNNPAKFLLNKRLHIYLDQKDSVLMEKESFDLNGLDKYFLGRDLVEKKLDTREPEQFFALKKASGQLPHGTVGTCIYDRISQETDQFVKKIQPYIQGTALKPLEVDLSLNGFRLNGKIDAIYPERLVHYRYAKVKSSDRIKTWIHHLVLNCRNGSGYGADSKYPRFSMLAGSDSMWKYEPLENSEAILETLLEKYWEGLKKPLHFFPKTSWEYADMILGKSKSSEAALQKAQNAWTGGDWSSGEIEEDFYFQLCFEHANPLDSEFQKTALEIFEPLINVQEEVSSVE
ncbi:exodeoxyribonuclease V subunit gamma [Desulfonema magnum]|uniref:Exodeoxyribonuclease V, subunit gamma n=1 Tax=Desulfonema magnum TaxID=45655 RepID=A0A975BNU3_9BACT|nr:exodeoxyribonuclease V subunit gamma [Desulfonema magnum]QTA88951.1 Exodeoxyribonuclease V, subunit gamma [Desulfonema magnum]